MNDKNGDFYSFAFAGDNGVISVYRFKLNKWNISEIEKFSTLKTSIPSYKIDYATSYVISFEKCCLVLGSDYFMVDTSNQEKTLEISQDSHDFNL